MRAADSAATKIQAGFRGYRVRKQLRLARQNSGGGQKAVDGSARGGSEQQRKPPANEASAPQRDSPAPGSGADDASCAAAQLDVCAAKIQAGVRGFLVRRRYTAQHRAASTIQASFRAFRARREARLRAAAKI